MKIKLLFCLLMAFCFFSAPGQQLYTFSGKITDASSVPLAGTSVYLLNTNRGTATDDQGNFTFKNLSPGKYTVQLSAIGYAVTNVDVTLGSTNSESVDIKLADAAIQLDAVVVSAQKTEESLQHVPFSISALSSRQVKQYRLWNSKRTGSDCSQSLFFQLRRRQECYLYPRHYNHFL
jgi:iron complex outermembrane receptor protein